MKKIQISTVKQTADVQVINLNAYLVAKAVRAHVELENLLGDAHLRGAIEELFEVSEDANGNVERDEMGSPVMKPKMVNGKVEVRYSSVQLDGYHIKALAEYVFPFLEELTKSFEED